MQNAVFQPGVGPIRAAHYLPADPSAVLRGRLPCPPDSPVLTIDPGDEVSIDTISHDGIHEDLQRVAVAGDVCPHSVPPRPHDGNIDIDLLTVGSSLSLPVQAEGALASSGDAHFAQGDGEVALGAMEASLWATLRLDVLSQQDALEAFGALVGPLVQTTEYLVLTGMDEDLDEAVKACVPRSPWCRPDSHSTPQTPMRTSARRRTSTSRRSWIS